MRDVRGDHVGWFNGSETADGDGGDPLWRRLPDAMKRADTLVHELGQLGGDARDVASRSKAMCTVYPGAGARYVRHVDNPDQNGRLLTALLYLNPDWQEGDGGELIGAHGSGHRPDVADLAGSGGTDVGQVPRSHGLDVIRSLVLLHEDRRILVAGGGCRDRGEEDDEDASGDEGQGDESEEELHVSKSGESWA